jgi:hypothetical protein
MVALVLFTGALLSTIVDNLIQQQQHMSTTTTGYVFCCTFSAAPLFSSEAAIISCPTYSIDIVSFTYDITY